MLRERVIVDVILVTGGVTLDILEARGLVVDFERRTGDDEDVDGWLVLDFGFEFGFEGVRGPEGDAGLISNSGGEKYPKGEVGETVASCYHLDMFKVCLTHIK